MFKKIKNIITKIDLFLFKLFGSEKNVKFLVNSKEAKIVFSYLNDIGKETNVRFVGGCVRKVLNGENIDDIDLSTSLEPQEVKKRLDKEKIKVLDTGISHGTVTAILNKKKFEITTLRKDISTDGRHAKVQFTPNWKEDALRRDFTINAIYVDIDGQILDPLNGRSDLRNGKVKFIGSPSDRVKEDYLRILRYFRFFIQYSKVDYDQDIIHCIKQNINGLNKISNERIFDELKKILKLNNVLNLFLDKTSSKIFSFVFPQLRHYKRLEKIQKLDPIIKNQLDKIFILSLLIVDKSDNYEYFCHKYKVSNKIKKRFSIIASNFEALESENFFKKENIRKYLYYNTKDSVKDLLLFTFFINEKNKFSELEDSMNYLYKCEKPIFPFSGNFLKEKGLESGEKLGKILKKIESEWISNNFNLDEDKVNELLKKQSNSKHT